MAENSTLSEWKTSVPCRFFVNGMCREGDRCKYLHEDSASQYSAAGNESKVLKGNVRNSPKIHTTSEIDEGCSGTSTCSNTDNSNGYGANTTANSSTPEESNERVVGDTSSVSHLNTRASQSTSEPVICQYFQQGCCMFGDNCFNKHDKVEDSSISKCCNTLDEQHVLSDANTSDGPSTSDVDTGSSVSSTEESKDKDDDGCTELLATIQLKTRLRVNAPEFIPSGFTSAPLDISAEDEVNNSNEASAGKTWAQVVNSSAGNGIPSPFTSLCPYAQAGDCPYAEDCTYVHGDTCEFCGNACLHPTNEEQRKSHTDECIKQHEREMELAFAVARSKDKQCGVCFEVVVDKNPASEQRFGILPNCNHCFCLACIRKWRQAKQFENKIIRACPECRVTSDFVCPSMYWVDTKEEKDKLILAYKDALSNKQCKYFKQGRGKCPFGNKCFYLHAYPDGTKVDTGPPIRRHRQNADGETDVLQLFLWDFLDERDNRWLYSLDDIDLMAILSGSDDSDTSDIEMF